jgi:hypothetical protein
VRSGPFALLVLACFLALWGGKAALAAWVPAAHEAAVAAPASPERPMIVPPKPAGLTQPAPAPDAAAEVPRLTEAACLARPATLHDLCFQALARQTAAEDPASAARTCARVVEEELHDECLADVAEAAAPAHRQEAVALCVAMPRPRWRGQCHFGIGLALAETDPAWAFGRCAHAEAFRDFCRHDVVGEIALADLEAAVGLCAREEGDALTRKSCWHGIGKYLARRDATTALVTCLRATPGWRGNCAHGAGWGAAERDADAALAACAAAGPYADNCRHGVAAQLKRIDPERALALCGRLADATLASRCTAFVRRAPVGF